MGINEKHEPDHKSINLNENVVLIIYLNFNVDELTYIIHVFSLFHGIQARKISK